MKGISSSTLHTLTHIMDITTTCENHIMKGMSLPHIHKYAHITHFHHSTLNLFPTKRRATAHVKLHQTIHCELQCLEWRADCSKPLCGLEVNLRVDLPPLLPPSHATNKLLLVTLAKGILQ